MPKERKYASELCKIGKDLTKQELFDLAFHYDWYVQDANEKDLFAEGWRPVCMAEFYDCEYQEIVKERKVCDCGKSEFTHAYDPRHHKKSVKQKDIPPTYTIDEKECEHLYRDASDERYCVDCGKKLDRADCGNCSRPATHSLGGIHRCERCKDL